MTEAQILIIEDDADINGVIASFLKKQGFICTQAFSGSEARLLLEQAASVNGDSKDRLSAAHSTGQSFPASRPFDLVITDLMLPGMTGQEIVTLVRSKGNMPVIVISALDSATDKLELFKLGADDYVVKPFDLEELYARVLVQLRHASHVPSDNESGMHFKNWRIDPEARQLSVSGETVKLTRTEYNIVEALVNRPKKVFSKRELYEAAWNEDCFIEEKAINVHVSNIRSKLKDTGTDHYIETVWGIGFKLIDEQER